MLLIESLLYHLFIHFELHYTLELFDLLVMPLRHHARIGCVLSIDLKSQLLSAPDQQFDFVDFVALRLVLEDLLLD